MIEDKRGEAWRDPIVAEVRAARQALWTDAGGDIETLARRLRGEQANSARGIVSFAPRPPQASTAAA